MKTKHIATLIALTAGLNAGAQSYLDAVRFNANDVEGTARLQAMGGAFGALGADLSSATINPGGLGSYRASEITMTLGLGHNKTETDYYNFIRDDDKFYVPFNQIGAAFTYGLKREKAKGIVSSTFAVGYTRLADYNDNARYYDMYGYNSMLDYFCEDGVNTNVFSGQLAYDAYLTNDTNDITFNIWENFAEDGSLDFLMREGVDENGNPVGLVDHYKYVKQKGYKGETTFAYAINISHIVNVGASLGIQSLYHKENTMHHEEYFGTPNLSTATSFEYRTNLKQNGTGVNFKIGAVVSPISALRLGVALHSPTFYSINERYNASIAVGGDVYYSPEGEYEYNYRTPGRLILSAAGVLGKYGIVSFDYERSNYSKSRFKNKEFGSSATFDALNDDVEDALKATNTIRVGLEARVLDPLYLRAGYRNTTSPYSSGIMQNSYKNSAFSGGIGYRQNNFFFDFAYVNSKQVNDYWVLPGEGIYEANQPAKLESNTQNFIITVGFRY